MSEHDKSKLTVAIMGFAFGVSLMVFVLTWREWFSVFPFIWGLSSFLGVIQEIFNKPNGFGSVEITHEKVVEEVERE